ncbi:hypothetical protein H310_11468 [Aphanomyces invadans]|uniref:Uncharacterized protein n=1 Tax=Aphanomyces invadans TaxID=157072 RepID=A0A024TL79_9STRA|nr:hypothetical protein H310_11468 [Aphanomyces invadans]ETV94793.1 hypothetical protein H310_11468 [Aphanomyces invadans]|eukprot:XP_008876384.1 hypothetical protein H310_11468 [Aphanomyces invadans]
MDGAAMNGHLSIIEFLHNHRHEGCTPRAIVHAAENGHLDIVQFLHENVDEEWPIDAVAAAGMHGHVDIVRYLCEHGFLFRSDDDVIVEMALALGDHCPEAKDLLLLMLGGDSGDN